ncbi:MAG: hypothetical protein ACFFCS_25065 [Candidatus Hodarchaeota archaeon]
MKEVELIEINSSNSAWFGNFDRIKIVKAGEVYETRERKTTVFYHECKKKWGDDKESIKVCMERRMKQSEGLLVEKRKIDRFIEAILDPAIPELDLAEMGVTKRWLGEKMNAPLVGPKFTFTTVRGPEGNMRRVDVNKGDYVQIFSDFDLVKEMLEKHYKGRIIDFYPSMKVKVLFADGEEIELHTFGQHLFLIPWIIKRGGKRVETYNSKISERLWYLLPERFLDKNMLKGKGILSLIQDLVYSHLLKKIREEQGIKGPFFTIGDKFPL